MWKKLGIAVSIFIAMIGVLLFFPPVRNWFFTVRVIPFPTPWDVSQSDIDELRSFVKPGDVIVERNIHSLQWLILCFVGTGSPWVHTALVDRDGETITMMVKVRNLPLDNYIEKGSTDMVLVRPPYKGSEEVEKTLAYADSKKGTEYDPSFENQAGNCTGLVATSMAAGGINLKTVKAPIIDKQVYPAGEFLNIPGAKVIWRLHGTPAQNTVPAASH